MENDTIEKKSSRDSWDDDPEIQEIKEMEENLEMEIMKNIIKEKKNAESVQNHSPVKLKVEVEVEMCTPDEKSVFNDEIKRIDDPYGIIDEPNDVIEATSPTVDDETNNFNVTTTIQSYSTLVHIHAEELVSAAKKYYESNNYAERYLSAALINSVYRMTMKTLRPDSAEVLVQSAIASWKIWYNTSRYADEPLFYKCYMCDMAWWYLGPFRDHLRNHKNVYKVKLENTKHEANIVAYAETETQPFKNIKIHGKCLKCDKSSINHFFMVNNSLNTDDDKLEFPYVCSKCPMKFPTCLARSTHEKHHENKSAVSCNLCVLRFQSKRLLGYHLRHSHTVRSDKPFPVLTRLCVQCHSSYPLYKAHQCSTKWRRWCQKCFKQFETKSVEEAHTNNFKTEVSCRICLKALLNECCMVEHYLSHTNNFTIEHMCVQCNFFLHKRYKKEHVRNCHNDNPYFDKRPWYLPMIVPTQLFLSKIKGLDGTEVQVEYEQKPIPKPVISKQDELEAALKSLKEEMDDDLDICTEVKQEQICIDLTSESELDETVVKTEKDPEEFDDFVDDIIKFNLDKKELMKIKETCEISSDEDSEVVNRQKTVNTESTSVIIQPACIPMMETHFCTKCVKEYENRFTYLSHFTQHNYRPYMCPYCLQISESMIDFCDHFTSHIDNSFSRSTKYIKDDTMLQCKQCNRSVYKNEVFPHWENHFVMIVLEEDSKYYGPAVVESRGKRMSESILLVVLDYISTNKRSKSINFCVVCLKQFKQPRPIKKHMIEHLLNDALMTDRHKNSEKLYSYYLKCQICGELLNGASDFKVHMRDHASMPFFKCRVCEKTFSTLSYFQKHKMIHEKDLTEISEMVDVSREPTEIQSGSDNLPHGGTSELRPKIGIVEKEPEITKAEELKLHTEIKLEIVDEFEEDIININSEISAMIKSKTFEKMPTENDDISSSTPSTSKGPPEEIDSTLANVKIEVMDQYDAASIDSIHEENDTNENIDEETYTEQNDHDYYKSEDSEASKDEDFIISPPKKRRGRKGIEKYDPHTCTKCDVKFDNLCRYLLHFDQHGYKENACPQCRKNFESIKELLPHIKIHINHMFLKIKFLRTEEKAGNMFKCRHCKCIVMKCDFFPHWEKHLVFQSDREPRDVDVDNANLVKQEGLPEGTMKEITDLLLDEKTHIRGYNTRRCVICQRHFNRRGDLKRHLIEHLLDDAKLRGERNFYNWSLRCQLCSVVLSDTCSYKAHVREHASMPIYTCELCDRVFSDSSNFTKHKKVHNMEKCRCKICDKKFQTVASLDKHMEIHDQTPIKCPYCPVTSYTASLSRRHIRMYHLKEPKLLCPLCPAQFVTVKEKWDHLWEKHKLRKETWDCNVCDASYRKFRDLKDHYINVHHVKYLNVMLGKKKEKIKQLLKRKVKKEPMS